MRCTASPSKPATGSCCTFVPSVPGVVQRVGDDHLLDRGRLDAVERSRTKNTPCVTPAYTSSAPRARIATAAWHSVRAVVTTSSEHHGVLALDVADDVHDLDRVRLRTALVHEREVGVQALRVRARHLHRADVRSDHDEVRIYILLK